MNSPANATVGCLLVGEYVDEGDCPANLPSCRSEAVPTRLVANYLDLWGRDDGMREFTVLLRDGRVVVVRGHALKHEPSPQGGQDVYGIVVRSGGEEVLVALFKSHDVSGIFCGELRSDRRIA
jgi:hypothetical protein